ncbi:MAG: methyltransferase domain-containing protein [Lewinellaceae bacterium]|nr:methyltransferase domain-containing protein [Phaeodactylibacter sp.]MCB9039085.1 methyltransferase domain-containing protein [Lewinellaceae bacterium]
MKNAPEKYDQIAPHYNHTRQADPYLLERLFHHLNPQKGSQYLDIGCGTGNYTIALHRKGIAFTGVDPSEEMLKKARLKCSTIDWKQGKAEALPLGDNAVDGILASLTLHHWTSLDKGFRELSRVLKPGGRIVVFTSTPEQMQGYWLNRYFPKMMEDSMVQMPAYAVVEGAMNQGGFEVVRTEKYFVQPDLKDLFLYSGKHRPALYFDPKARRGISSFSALANAVEVKEGLARLERDVDSGEIDEVVKHYKNDKGDYLFVIAEKVGTEG